MLLLEALLVLFVALALVAYAQVAHAAGPAERHLRPDVRMDPSWRKNSDFPRDEDIAIVAGTGRSAE